MRDALANGARILLARVHLTRFSIVELRTLTFTVHGRRSNGESMRARMIRAWIQFQLAMTSMVRSWTRAGVCQRARSDACTTVLTLNRSARIDRYRTRCAFEVSRADAREILIDQ